MSLTHEPVTAADEADAPFGYALFAVFRRNPADPQPANDASGAAELERAVETATSSGVTIRGWYDVSGLKADADLMIWLHGPDPQVIQSVLRELRRATPIARLLPTWNAMGVHRAAEFNRAHVPGFLRGLEPRGWLTLYPFVRDAEWYLLPDEDRSRMLADHGRKGATHTSVVANTISAFALGDYEWLLPMESDELTDLVDLMRHLRATDARRHMREETPFYTGRRIALSEVLDVLR